MHVHVRKAGGFAKFWMEPVELEFSQGLKVAEIRKAEELVLENLELIKNKTATQSTCSTPLINTRSYLNSSSLDLPGENGGFLPHTTVD